MTSDQYDSAPEQILRKGPGSGVGPDLDPNCMTSDQSDSVLERIFRKSGF